MSKIVGLMTPYSTHCPLKIFLYSLSFAYHSAQDTILLDGQCEEKWVHLNKMYYTP